MSVASADASADTSAKAPPASPHTETPSGGQDVLIGGLCLFLGVAITAGTYLQAAERGGGQYVVAWGAMLFGGLRLFRGLSTAGRK